MILQEQDSGLISEDKLEKDNSTDYSIVAKKYSLKMEFKVFIKALEFQFSVSSPIELSISGITILNDRGYDAGKRFIWGSTE